MLLLFNVVFVGFLGERTHSERAGPRKQPDDAGRCGVDLRARWRARAAILTIKRPLLVFGGVAIIGGLAPVGLDRRRLFEASDRLQQTGDFG